MVVDLEFDTAEHAGAFLTFLEGQIWSNPKNAPALNGTSEAGILERVQVNVDPIGQ